MALPVVNPDATERPTSLASEHEGSSLPRGCSLDIVTRESFPPTISGLLDAATRKLQDNGFRTPRLDAELLLGEVLGMSRTAMLTWPERLISSPPADCFHSLLARRLEHEPVAYILGRRGFYDFTLQVDRNVLIPREDTERLVDEAISWLRSRSHPHVLDVGTGSGAIAIAIARHCPTATVVGSDISTSALEVAARNARTVGVSVDWRKGSLLEVVRQNEQFDLVVANLPYISAQEFETLERNVRDYEPITALVADDNGLALIHQLCDEVGSSLHPGGALALEIGAGQAAPVTVRMHKSGFTSIRVVTDLSGHDRVVWGQSWTRP